MSGWQILFLALLIAASKTGRPSISILIAMWGNFIATFFLNDDLRIVAMFDVMAAALLTMRGRREAFIATLFVAMVPIYLFAHHLEWAPYAVYAAIDVLAYIQIAAMGKWDDGLGNIYRDWRLRRTARRSAVAARCIPTRSARVSEKEGKKVDG